MVIVSPPSLSFPAVPKDIVHGDRNFGLDPGQVVVISENRQGAFRLLSLILRMSIRDPFQESQEEIDLVVSKSINAICHALAVGVEPNSLILDRNSNFVSQM